MKNTHVEQIVIFQQVIIFIYLFVHTFYYVFNVFEL